MAWFRFYDDVLDDPKVQRLPPDIFKSWVNLLCLTKRHGGILPSIPDIAFALRISDTHAEQIVDKLQCFGLLDNTETGLKPHNWNGRQYKSDVSTERVKRFRKRHETVSEAELERLARDRDRTDTDTDTEEEIYIRQFDDFWSLVPIKRGKGQARKAFKAALKKTDFETLKAGIIRYAREAAGKDDEFIAHPATWLNGERWTDEPEREPHAKHREPSAHDTMLAAHAFAAHSRDNEREAPAPEPDIGGEGNAGKSAPHVPKLPRAGATG